MCGLCGIFRQGESDGIGRVQSMAERLAPRGPDDAGVWAEPRGELWLGHRRLAVLDLSPAGHQPMASATGRYVIVYNGEIYNHLELRETLTGVDCVDRATPRRFWPSSSKTAFRPPSESSSGCSPSPSGIARPAR